MVISSGKKQRKAGQSAKFTEASEKKVGILAQSTPAATTWVDLYTVDAGKYVDAKLQICNTSGGAITFRIQLDKGGTLGDPATAAAASVAYVQTAAAWDVSLASKGNHTTETYLLGANDVVRVYASAVDMSFILIGTEYSV